MLRFVLLLCAVALVKGQTTQVQRCTHHSGPLPINTYIVGCIQPPCNLPQLQDAIINIIFRAPHTMHRMRTSANAFYLPSTTALPYPLGANSVTCDFLTNTYCPVVTGEVIQYQLRMYILERFPLGTQVDVEFRIVDDSNNNVVCIRVPIRIVEPVTRRGGANATLIDQAD